MVFTGHVLAEVVRWVDIRPRDCAGPVGHNEIIASGLELGCRYPEWAQDVAVITMLRSEINDRVCKGDPRSPWLPADQCSSPARYSFEIQVCANHLVREFHRLNG